MKGEEIYPLGEPADSGHAPALEEALELSDEELEDVTGGLGVWHLDVPARPEEEPSWRGW